MAQQKPERAAGDAAHLCKHAAAGPDVDAAAVLSVAHKELGRSVPPGGHVLAVLGPRGQQGARKPEIAQLEDAGAGDEQVFRLRESTHSWGGVRHARSLQSWRASFAGYMRGIEGSMLLALGKR